MPATLKLSIIVPVYNGAKYLRHALKSIAGQSENNFEIEVIAADDGSSDGSVGILKEMTNELALKVIEGTKTGNWVSTTNKAVREASGEYISFLHQDDIYFPERLKKCGKILSENRDISHLIHSVNYISATGKIIGKWTPPFSCGHLSDEISIPRLMVQNNISVPGVIFKKELAERVGLLDDKLRYTADWDFWLKMLLIGKAYYLPENLSAFRIHKESQTVSFASKQKEYAENLRIVVDRYSNHLPALIPPRKAESYIRLAKFGTATNIFLARLNNKATFSDFKQFLTAFCRISPREFVKYLWVSRIFQRVISRIKL